MENIRRRATEERMRAQVAEIEAEARDEFNISQIDSKKGGAPTENDDEDDATEAAIMLGVGAVIIAVSIGFVYRYLKKEGSC